MKLRYLQTAAHGLKWMRRYFKESPQLDIKAASASLKRAEQVLVEFPFYGGKYEDFETVREHHIGETAFSLLYTVSFETVWIIDVRDTRGSRGAEALREFIKELRRKNELR